MPYALAEKDYQHAGSKVRGLDFHQFLTGPSHSPHIDRYTSSKTAPKEQLL